MALVALLVSILALIFAGASAYYTRQQAHSQYRVERIEAQRHSAERTPEWEPLFERTGDGGGLLRLRLKSLEPLDSIAICIVEGEGIHFTPSQTGIDPSEPYPPRNATWERINPGEAATWRLALAEDRSRDLNLRLLCTARDDGWEVPVRIDIPGDPSVFVL